VIRSAARGASHLLTGVASRPAVEAFLTQLEARVRRSVTHLPVLTYHRIDHRPSSPYLDPGLISATPEHFEDQVAWLRRRFRVLAIDEVERALARGRVPPRSMVITFDDGYDDFLTCAWPPLRDAGLPVTLFVTTGGLDEPQQRFWWDRLHHAMRRTTKHRVATPEGPIDVGAWRTDPGSDRVLRRRLKELPHDRLLGVVAAVEAAASDSSDAAARPSARRLSWAMLERLQAEGVTLAPHTRSHPLLTRVDDVAVEREVEGSQADLAARCPGARLDAFAYPSGAYDDRVVGVLARRGIRLAFTTDRGLNDVRRADRLRLRRFNVGYRSGPGLLAGQLMAAPFVWRAPPVTDH
jgi:peptidoglycan/xylan/chitin deacetylase (PgdA/CDA1 family)